MIICPFDPLQGSVLLKMAISKSSRDDYCCDAIDTSDIDFRVELKDSGRLDLLTAQDSMPSTRH